MDQNSINAKNTSGFEAGADFSMDRGVPKVSLKLKRNTDQSVASRELGTEHGEQLRQVGALHDPFPQLLIPLPDEQVGGRLTNRVTLRIGGDRISLGKPSIRIETPRVETPRVETPRVETPRISIPQISIPKISLTGERKILLTQREADLFKALMEPPREDEPAAFAVTQKTLDQVMEMFGSARREAPFNTTTERKAQ